MTNPRDIMDFRSYNMLDGLGGRTEPTFQSNPLLDPTTNAQMPNAGYPTQDSVLESQSRGLSEHPDATKNWIRLKSILDSMYTPQTGASDRYNKLLDNMPEINTPGIGRKIAAAGQALGNVGPHFTRTGGGQDAADRVLYAPFLQDMAAFKEKAEPFYKAADLENRQNINERTLASNTAQNIVNMDKNDTARFAAEAKAESDRIRARAYDYGQRLGKGWDWNLTGPTAKKINRTTGEIFDTGIQTGKMDEETKLDLMNQNKLDVQESRNQGNLAVQGSRNAGNLATAQERGATAEEVARIRTAMGGPKTMTPAAVGTDRLNKVQDILSQYPELGEYIVPKNRIITVHPPEDGWIIAADPELKKAYARAMEIIFPKNPTTSLNTPQGTLTGVKPGDMTPNTGTNPPPPAKPQPVIDPS
jgi:hypothetical protein